MEYKVTEDTAGMLCLFVFDENGRVIYANGGYESYPGNLSANLDALDNGEYPAWDSNIEDPGPDPQELWDRMSEDEYGWVEICSGKDGVRKLYKDNMGTDAKREFGISDNL